ncbi:MAG: c-type cytochrome, partial [Pedobacter sp.]
DGSLFVGETNRGWGSAGDANEGLERLTYNKDRTPFEMRAVRAMSDGFEIEFTLPVDRKSAEDLASYSVESFLYKYHPVYGSPPINKETLKVKGVKVSADGMRARIIVDNLRQYYIHTINVEGLRQGNSTNPLLHPTAYYTLNSIPTGDKLSLSEVSTKNSASSLKAATSTKTTDAIKAKVTNPAKNAPEQKAAPKVAIAPTFAQVKGLLTSYTCTACHNPDKKQIGPAFREVAKRKYTNEKILELIHNPQPQNWPGYATEMPPMPQVTKEDGLKIAAWINSFNSSGPPRTELIFVRHVTAIGDISFLLKSFFFPVFLSNIPP